jgi:O-antigen/teichoic acid export membrane protein
LGGNALIYGLGQVLSRFVSFLLLPLFTRELTPTDYGVTSILGLLTILIASVFSLGFGTSLGVVYFDSETPERRASVIWSAVAILGVSAALLLLATAAASGWLAEVMFVPTPEYDLAGLIRLSMAAAAVSLLVPPLLQYLQFEERARDFVVISLISTGVSIGLSIGAVVGLHLRVPGLLVANLLGQFVALALASVPVIRRLPFRLSWQPAGELVRLGLPLIPAFGFLFLMQQANKLVLQAEAGLDAVGVYAIGFNLGLLMSLLVGSFTTAWYPFFLSFTHRQEEAKAVFSRVTTYYILGFGLLDIGFFLGAKAVVGLMTEPAFHDAYLAVGFSAAAQYCIGIFSLTLAGMYFAKQVKFTGVIQAPAAVLSIVAAIVLTPRLGIVGAALSLLIGHLAMVGLLLWWNRLRGYLPIPYEQRRIAAFLAIHGLAVGAALWPRDLPIAVEIAFATVAFGVAVTATIGLLTAQERGAAAAAASGWIRLATGRRGP